MGISLFKICLMLLVIICYWFNGMDNLTCLIEGVTADVTADVTVYSFHAYFGREKTEDGTTSIEDGTTSTEDGNTPNEDGNTSTDVIELHQGKVYTDTKANTDATANTANTSSYTPYTINNIDLADLGGELAFFDKEILLDQMIPGTTKPLSTFVCPGTKCTRRYGIDKIDKWLIKYKPNYASRASMENRPLTDFASIDEQQANVSEDILAQIKSYPGSIGYQPQGTDGAGSNWLSSFGECLNHKRDEKCTGPYSKNCTGSSFTEDCLKYSVDPNNAAKTDAAKTDAAKTDEAKTEYMKSSVCPDGTTDPTGAIDCQIVGTYVGTIRLDDLGYPNNPNKTDDCANHVKKKLVGAEYWPAPDTPPPLNDTALPFWQGVVSVTDKTDKTDPLLKYANATKMFSTPDFWCNQTDVNTFKAGPATEVLPTHKIGAGGFFEELNPVPDPVPDPVPGPVTPHGVACTSGQLCPGGQECPEKGECPPPTPPPSPQVTENNMS
jgi:hypothetical protein